MARRPANITQADVARVIRAAKQAGAVEVEVWAGKDAKIIIRLAPSTGQADTLETTSEIVL
jgi:hypothetical protein